MTKKEQKKTDIYFFTLDFHDFTKKIQIESGQPRNKCKSDRAYPNPLDETHQNKIFENISSF